MIQPPPKPDKRQRTAMRFALLLAVMISMSMTGCTALFSPLDTIPAARLPDQFKAEAQASKVPLNPARLRQTRPEFYTLDSKDVLGVFIEGVLGNADEAPPVQLPDANSDLPPAIGFPVPVREDGTLSLPSVRPIPVRGLTIKQAEELIQRAYRGGPDPILKEGGRIIVTLFRERTFRVFVVRQDNSTSQRQMPAYKNDVLNALLQTGGIPGVNAKPEIRILRGNRFDNARRDRRASEFYRTADPSQFAFGQIPNLEDDANTIKIPLRLKPGEVPDLRAEDVILRDGDVIYVDTRETDVYYTSGLLQGGEFPLPRDYDLDVLAAVSLAGNGFATGQQTGFLGGAAQNVPPTELVVLRRIPGDRQLAIRIDLNDAINDPRQRLLVKQGDTLILRFKPQEEILNLVSNVFFTFGVRRLFN